MFVRNCQEHEDGERREHQVFADPKGPWNVRRVCKYDVGKRRCVRHVFVDKTQDQIVHASRNEKEAKRELELSTCKWE
jgi:hypothetical protein